MPYRVTNPTGLSMLRTLDDYYAISDEMNAIMQTEGVELDRIKASSLDARFGFFIRTSVVGFIRLWEKEYGISPIETKPLDERISVVLAKKRGIGTVTKEMIKNVAQSYDRGLVEVTSEPTLKQFTIIFMDTLGVPPNLQDLMDALNEIKPAHLTIKYRFRYLRIKELNAMKIKDLNKQKLKNFAGER